MRSQSDASPMIFSNICIFEYVSLQRILTRYAFPSADVKSTHLLMSYTCSDRAEVLSVQFAERWNVETVRDPDSKSFDDGADGGLIGEIVDVVVIIVVVAGGAAVELLLFVAVVVVDARTFIMK